MAMDIQEIIRINTEQGRESLAKLRKEIADLRAALMNLDETSEEYRIASEQIYRDQQKIAGVMNASKKNVDAEEGSMNKLLATLRQLKEAWKATGDAEERARIGEQVNAVKSQINEMNESIGNYQHNVGNYTNSIIEAFSKMGVSFGGSSAKFMSMAGMMIGGLGKLGAAFKSLWATMLANPIGVVLAAVGALIGAMGALRNAIRNNEESENRLHEAMSAFRPIADKFRNWLDKVGQGFVQLVEALAQAWEWLRKTYAAYTDWIGATEGRKERVMAEQEFARSLAKDETALKRLSRETERMNATDEDTIANFRELASMTTDTAKRTEYLTKARDAQIRVNERNVKLAEAEYDILKRQASTTNNSIEVNDKLLEAELKVSRTRNAGRMALLRLNRAISSGTEAMNKHSDATDKNAEALKRQREEMLRAHEEERKEAEQILKESEEALKSETEKEEEEYQRRRQLLMDHNLSTEALDEEHDRKIIERLEEGNREILEKERERLDYEEEMRKKAAAREEDPNALDVEAVVERNNAELEAYTEYIEAKIALNEALMDSYEEGSEEYTALERQNARLHEDMLNERYKTDKKNGDAYKKLMAAREKSVESMGKGVSSILKGVSKAFGENTKAAKGFAIAAATIDTIQAAIAGFKAGYNQWKDMPGPLAAMAPIQGAINAAAALAAGFAQVQQIKSVDTSGNISGGGSAMAVAIPNIEGLGSPVDYTRQVTTETEREEMNRDSRVYILESDIQESNNRVRVREAESTF